MLGRNFTACMGFKPCMSRWRDNFMEHETIVRNMQFAWEFFRAVGPAVVLGVATYWVTTWGEKAR